MAPHRKPNPGSLRSLAEAMPGEQLEVVHVLFESLRQKYEELGLGLETPIRCRGRTAEAVLVDLADGRLVAVDAVHAPFLEVRPPASRTAMGSEEPGDGGEPAPDPGPIAPFPDRSPQGEPGLQPRIA